ncbi:MAG: DUF6782 family putative metallopeptidase [Acidobacteriota bacterium]
MAVQAQAPDPGEILALADQVLARISELRQLPVLAPVARELHDEASLRAYIARRLEEEYPGDELEREQRVLEALGLLPEGVDLAQAMQDLYAAQIAGYYDPQKRILYISEHLPALLQAPTLAHELTHALQNQHFKIERFFEHTSQDLDDDTRIAWMGLMEGDATATMLAYMLPAQSTDDWLSVFDSFGRNMTAAMEALRDSSTPEFLLQMLNFPYRHGTPFVASLYREGGWEAVNAAHRRPPRSSEQVLHPARYAPPADEPTALPPSLFPARLESGGTAYELYHDLVLGEFVTRLVLEPRVGKEAALSASEGWDGDRVALYAGGGGDLLAWLSVWDSEAEAQEFVEAGRQREGNAQRMERRGARAMLLFRRGAGGEIDLGEIAGHLWEIWQ